MRAPSFFGMSINLSCVFQNEKKGFRQMKKSLLLSGVACSVMLVGAGCAMCSNPIPKDPSCIEDSHRTNISVAPMAMTKVAPVIAPTKTMFRPVYRAGAKVFGYGKGFSEEEAVADAISNIMAESKCDYLVAVTHVTTFKTHPTWRLFSTTNYSVKISGIPIFLERLEEEKLPEPPAPAPEAANGAVPPPPVCGAAPNAANPQRMPEIPLSLIRLSDIKVHITANGGTDDKAGVIFPIK